MALRWIKALPVRAGRMASVEARRARAMTLVLRSTDIQTVRHVRVPVMLVPRNDADPRVVSDGYRYRSISSLQALALAVVASPVTPVLLRLVL